jgi:hypothetical protein
VTDLAPIEYLYGTYTAEDGDGYVKTRVIPFRIVKKTAKRIFYVKDWIHGETDRLGSVDRRQLEATGEVYQRSRGYWNADFHLYAEIPDIDSCRLDRVALKAELVRLRTEMADVHPDRGGTDAAFIAARERYEAVRSRFTRVVGMVDVDRADSL